MENLIEDEIRKQTLSSYQSAESIQSFLTMEREMRLATGSKSNCNNQTEGSTPDGRFFPVSTFNPTVISG